MKSQQQTSSIDQKIEKVTKTGIIHTSTSVFSTSLYIDIATVRRQGRTMHVSDEKYSIVPDGKSLSPGAPIRLIEEWRNGEFVRGYTQIKPNGKWVEYK